MVLTGACETSSAFPDYSEILERGSKDRSEQGGILLASFTALFVLQFFPAQTLYLSLYSHKITAKGQVETKLHGATLMLAPRLGPMIGKGDLDPHGYHSTHPQAPIPKHGVPLLPPIWETGSRR